MSGSEHDQQCIPFFSDEALNHRNNRNKLLLIRVIRVIRSFTSGCAHFDSLARYVVTGEKNVRGPDTSCLAPDKSVWLTTHLLTTHHSPLTTYPLTINTARH